MTRPIILGVFLGGCISALAVWTSPTGRWLRGSLAAAPEPIASTDPADDGVGMESAATGNESARQSPRITPPADRTVSLEDPAADVRDLARRMAPALAREAAQGQGFDAPALPDVTRELLEVYKEQQEIQSGKRGTIDDVLREAR